MLEGLKKLIYILEQVNFNERQPQSTLINVVKVRILLVVEYFGSEKFYFSESQFLDISCNDGMKKRFFNIVLIFRDSLDNG